MAYIPKSKRTASAKSEKQSTDDSVIKGIFAELASLNEDASLLSDNTVSLVDEWIDTGSLALNAIFSGSLYKGVPRGRITGFSGPSQAGKSHIINKIIANAQKKGYFAAVWDSEAAIDRNSAINLGVDPARVSYYPVETIENCRNQIATFLDRIIAAKDPNLKVIIAIDSLGNLCTQKELEDIISGKSAMDMGLRAKALKSMMRTFTYKSAKAKVPILFTNHIYDNPGEMHPSLVKTQAGGKGPVYIASLLVQLSIRNEAIAKNEGEAKIGIAHNVSGVTLGALTVKNRFIPPYLKTELYLNFKSGLDKYAGLKDLAIGMGLIEATGSTYSFQGEKIGYAKTWENSEEFWEKKALPALEIILQKELCYNTTPDLEDLDIAGDDQDVDPDQQASET